MTHSPSQLPPLQPLHVIERCLSSFEYYHASVGRHPAAVLRPREVIAIVEGRLTGAVPDWQAALNVVVAQHPGCRLRLSGDRWQAHWTSDGLPPALRQLPDVDWDGRSSQGDEFIYATPLSLEEGPTCELIVAGRGEHTKVIFRALHAVMDGLGVIHFLLDLFRALRGEPLQGCNAAYSDVDLMRHLPSQRPSYDRASPVTLDAADVSAPPGGRWCRITLPGPQHHLIPRIARLVARHARQQTGASLAPVRIALPVSLKRHVPELLSTANFTNMVYLEVAPEATNEQLHAQFQGLLKQNVDAHYPRIFSAIRALPLRWLDRLLSPNGRNYAQRKVLETAVLSVLGPFRKVAFSGGGFQAEALYGVPQKESTFIVAIGFQGRYELTIGMAHLYASAGRLEAFVTELEQQLKA